MRPCAAAIRGQTETEETGRTYVPWFRVDDSFHSHPKVLATSPAALGLWVVAGSWSSAHLTDGVVPDRVLPLLLPDAATLAGELVAAGLWKRIRGGYKFHEWQIRNPLKKAVEEERKNNAERQRRWRESHSNGVTNAPTNGVTNSAPARPFPTDTGPYEAEPPLRARDRSPNSSMGRPNDTAAARHPSARSMAEAERAAGLTPGHRPASEEAKAAAVELARRAFTERTA